MKRESLKLIPGGGRGDGHDDDHNFDRIVLFTMKLSSHFHPVLCPEPTPAVASHVSHPQPLGRVQALTQQHLPLYQVHSWSSLQSWRMVWDRL